LQSSNQDTLKPNDPLADENYAKYPDASCQACHPLKKAVNNLSPKFKNFWIDWFTPIRRPKYLTQCTINLFEAAQKEEDFNQRLLYISALVQSVRYTVKLYLRKDYKE